MKALRVGQVTLTMGQGGIENLIISLAGEVKAMQLSLYCLDAGGELLAAAEKLGVPARIFQRRPGLDWRLVIALARAFRQDAVQVVHTHNEAAHFYGCLAARLARVPVVVNTEHSRHYIDGHWKRRLEKRILSVFTDQMVAVSEELRQLSVDRDGLDGSKCRVVRNGVDLEKFASVAPAQSARVRSALGISEKAPVIAIVARLYPVKNHGLLLSAVQLLRKSGADACLVVVGDGELRGELEAEAARLGIGDRAFFLGSRGDVPELLAASDVLVLCSHSEGSPLVLLEAMASGTPVVVTEGANRAGLVVPGDNGWVCRSTPADLAATLKAALFGGKGTGGMVERARIGVAQRYSIESTVQQYEELFYSLLLRKAPLLAGEVTGRRASL